MKTSTQKRVARLSGLLLLSLLVGALAVTAAQAMHFSGASVPSTSAGSGTSNAAQSQPGWAWGYYYSDAGASKLLAAGAQRGYYSTVAVSGTSNALQLPTLAQVRQHHGAVASTFAGSGTSNALQLPTLAQVRQHHGAVPTAYLGSGTQSASSGISSTTVWIAAAAVAGVLLIGTWALLRRRRQREEARACELSVAGC